MFVVSGITPLTVHVYVQVSPDDSFPSDPTSPEGPLTVQPARLSLTLTSWKKPEPVDVTHTVNVTSAPSAGTVDGRAVFETLIAYVGAAADTQPTAPSSMMPALRPAPQSFRPNVAPIPFRDHDLPKMG